MKENKGFTEEQTELLLRLTGLEGHEMTEAELEMLEYERD